LAIQPIVAAKMILTAKPLTKEAFSPYGDVIEVTDQAEKMVINYGLTQRFNALAKVDANDDQGRGIISIFRSTPKNNNKISDCVNQLTIDCMERHPLSSQAFYPLSSAPYLVVVAPKGYFDTSKIKAFIAGENQGVNYHKGTWHHYCLALKKVADFLVIDRQGEGKNCDEIDLSSPITIEYCIEYTIENDLSNRSGENACQ